MRGRDSGPRARAPVKPFDPDSVAEPVVVTDLTPHARRAGRLQVEVNGARVGAVAIDLAADAGLRPGATLTRRELNELLASCRRTALLDKGLDVLAVRARSTRDLSLRLRRAGGADADIAWVVARLAAQGFLDDDAHALAVARQRLQGGVSRRRVESELRKRGIDAETVAEAMGIAGDEVGFDELSAARAAARARLRALRTLDPATRRRRLYAWLARRGFEPDAINRVLRELDREEGSGRGGADDD